MCESNLSWNRARDEGHTRFAISKLLPSFTSIECTEIEVSFFGEGMLGSKNDLVQRLGFELERAMTRRGLSKPRKRCACYFRFPSGFCTATQENRRVTRGIY